MKLHENRNTKPERSIVTVKKNKCVDKTLIFDHQLLMNFQDTQRKQLEYVERC